MIHAVRFAVAIVLPLVAIWAEAVLGAAGATQYVFVATGLAVALSAWTGGLWAGILATLVAAAATDYVFLGPRTFLQFDRAVDGALLAVYGVGWLGVSALFHRDRVGRRRDRAARATAERAMSQKERVAQLSAALGRARTVAGVIEAAVQEPLHALRGDAAVALLLDEEGTATVGRAVGYDAGSEVDHAAATVTPGPLRDAIARRAFVTVETSEARTSEFGHQPPDPVTATYAAAAAVPVMVGGRPAAALRIDFREPRAFSGDDHEYLTLLSVHTSQALERALEQESDQRARIEAEGLRERADQELARRQTIEQALRASETRYRALASRTTRLHALTAALSEAVTTEAVVKAIVQQATVVVGATAADVLLTEDDPPRGAPDRPTPSPDLRRFVPEPGLCETDVITTRQPIFIRSWDESQERYWRSASAAADAAYSSSAALPLLVSGLAAGVLRFDFSVPVNFDEEYQALLVSVAQHCSQALDRARLYETAQRARADAEAASRLKDDFLSIVSHELRTPLNAVLGWASMLRRNAVDSALAQRAVQSIHDNATRQAKLIDDLLDVSRIAAGRATLDLQEVDVAALVAGVVESLVPAAASSDVALRLSPMAPALISGDRRRLEQVFFNLLGNALKFTPPGGAITIESVPAGGSVDVKVRDNGVGIAPEFLPFVFDRFRQADSTSTRSYGGLGLGLSIAKQLVEAHKGTIAVESEGTGHGTQFIVRLPLAEGARAVREERPGRPSTVEAPRLDGIRVLVVDDEPDARDVMACALGHHGADVTAAATAPEAYTLLMSGRFDVLLADIAMPGEDGCSLIRRVRASAQPEIALIPAGAVTAHARDTERRSVLAAGFHEHLVKPVEPEELARAVMRLARGGVDTLLTAT